MKLKLLFSAFLLFLVPFFSIGRTFGDFPDQPTEAILRKKLPQTIWLNGFSLLANEVRLSYEKGLPYRFALEAGAAYKYPQPIAGPFIAEYYGQNNYYTKVGNAPFSKGFSGFTTLKYYFKDPGSENLLAGFYVSGSVSFKNRNYQNRLVNNRNNSYGSTDEAYWDSSQSLELHTFGFSILPGYTFAVLPFSGSKAIMIDVFSGMGINIIKARTDFDWQVKEFSPVPKEEQMQTSAHVENSEMKKFPFQIGFKAGFRF
jgi:hypothetical protein